MKQMDNGQINQIIHSQVMGHTGPETCYGPVTISNYVGQPHAAWTCNACGASGEITDLTTSFAVQPHIMAIPNYTGNFTLAREAFAQACRTWSREQKWLFDWHLLGVGHLKIRSEFVRAVIDLEKPLVDRINEHMQPETICRAIIETLQEWERRQRRLQHESESWKAQMEAEK